MEKILLGIQARSKSTRLPGKIFEKIGDRSVLQWVYDAAYQAERILNAKGISSSAMILGFGGDDELIKHCAENLMKSQFPPFVAEDDLIQRYLKASKDFTHIVRITSDCWFASDELIAEIVQIMLKEKFDYISNTCQRSFFEGLDLQACSVKALEWFDENQKEAREHPFLPFDLNDSIRIEFEKKFKLGHLINPQNPWLMKTSIDDANDLDRARKMYEKLKEQK